MYNSCTFVGNLTKDPELRVTQTGKNVSNFTVAVSEGKDDNQITLFIDCTAWEKLAEIVDKYVLKGNKILVAGKLRQQRWTNKDGTYASKMVLLVEKLVMLTSKKIGEETKLVKPDEQNIEEQMPEINIDDIDVNMPF